MSKNKSPFLTLFNACCAMNEAYNLLDMGVTPSLTVTFHTYRDRDRFRMELLRDPEVYNGTPSPIEFVDKLFNGTAEFMGCKIHLKISKDPVTVSRLADIDFNAPISNEQTLPLRCETCKRHFHNDSERRQSCSVPFNPCKIVSTEL